MSYYINDNNFSRDNKSKREVRLKYLAKSVPKYAVELSISGEMLNWATNAFSEFNEQIHKDILASVDKSEAYKNFHNALEILTKRYQILKDLLISRYANDDSKLLIYGISGKTKRTIPEIIRSSEMLTVANAKLIEEGDTNVLPEAMISDFQSLIDDAKEKSLLAGMKREVATQESKKLNELFTADTLSIKAIYTWIITYWKKDDSRLLEFGFVRAKTRRGRRGPLAPTNVSFDASSKQLKFDESENATSYQVAIADAESVKTRWQKYYSGEKNEIIVDSKFSRTKVKIRARSANGFGKWSEEIGIGD